MFRPDLKKIVCISQLYYLSRARFPQRAFTGGRVQGNMVPLLEMIPVGVSAKEKHLPVAFNSPLS